ILYITNTLVFIIFVLLYLHIIPNIWNESTLGVGGRVNGPPIIAINLLLFYCLLKGIAFDRKLIIASIMGLICIALTTNFMNLAVFVVLIFLMAINFKKLFKPIYILGFVLLLLGGL